ncbi:hypothetical protein EV385_3430 [Krasilnikovia cinnamomea]|uniref:Type III secretion system (T3SS) SseB-like protein n=1 Tax=Krasilnikovia cinnamomea TaxID=349313 RepID=A0A4Q7ZMU1_9ACTN|nr:SAV_915 family protein [Krasilnikovia cinnamomea]RZU51599.1 hypothetical protein EV385_3430 [Krasilnikovia cinnamomea]
MTVGSGDTSTPANGTAAPHSPHAPFPPVVYVPCEPLREGDQDLTVEVRPTRDGRIALLVYSSLERLVDCCGPYQPWTEMPSTSLEDIRLTSGFNLVLLDLEVPDEFRRTESDL